MGPPQEVNMEVDPPRSEHGSGPPRSEHRSGPPRKWSWKRTPPLDGPAGWGTPPRSDPPPEVVMEEEPPTPHLDGPAGWGTPPLWMDQLGYPPCLRTDHTSAIHQLASGRFSFEKRISTCFFYLLFQHYIEQSNERSDP